MRIPMTFALIAALLPLQAFARPDFQAKLLAISDSTLIKVELKNKEKLQGLKGGITGEGFVLKISASGSDQDRKIAFQDVKSINKIDTKSHKARKIGIIIGGAAAGPAIIACIAFHQVTHW